MTCGELIAERRAELGLSQDDLARLLVDASGRPTLNREDVSRWERTKRLPSAFWLPHLAEILEVSLAELRKQVSFTRSLRRRVQQPMDDDLMSLLWLGGQPPSQDHGASRFTVRDVEHLLERSYTLDAEFGGGPLSRMVGRNLQVASNLFDSSLTPQDGERLRRAVAGLTQIAGWISIDASRHAEANRYLTAALYAAYESDDDPLAAHVIGYMALHALYRDRPGKAISLARTGVDRVQTVAEPTVRAILHTRLARGLARTGESSNCRRALDQATSAFDESRDEEQRPLWIQYVDPVELAAQRGACLLDLGDGAAAAEVLQQAISLMTTTAPRRGRDLVHYKTRLASAYLIQGEAEQAAAVAREAHHDAAQIDSARVGEQFDTVVDRLRGYDTPAVREVVDYVESPG